MSAKRVDAGPDRLLAGTTSLPSAWPGPHARPPDSPGAVQPFHPTPWRQDVEGRGAVQPRPEVASIAPCVHGAAGELELAGYGLSPSQVADFSVNSNPLGPAPGVRAALAATDAGRYPDDRADALRHALAECYAVEPDQIIAGNGSLELIWLLALAYVRPGDRVAIFGPTFGEYARAAAIMGARVVELRAGRAVDFAVDIAAAAEQVAGLSPRLVFLCNPNNPTGTLLAPGEVERLLGAAPDALFVVDEAYGAFAHDDGGPLAGALRRLLPLARTGRVVLLRSMTKDFALAGLRLGYAIAGELVVDALQRVRPPWSVNAAAQAAGLAALADLAHLERAQRAACEAVGFLRQRIAELGYRVYPTSANFLLVEVGDAAATRRALLPHGLVVRDCTSFGLPDVIRIAARPLPECRRLVAALAALKGTVAGAAAGRATRGMR